MKAEYDFSDSVIGAWQRGRMTVIYDGRWHAVDDGARPADDVYPGEEYDHVLTPQKPGLLHKILTRGHKLHLLRLQICDVAVPFELHRQVGEELRFHYRPTAQQHAADCKGVTARCGCARTAVPLLAGQDVHLTLRNDGATPIKSRVALLAYEENLP